MNISKKRIALIVLFILVGSTIASFANAGLISDVTDFLGITHEKTNADKINITDSGYAWNNIQKSGNEANFKTIVTNSSDKKTSFCWVLKDGVAKTSVNTTAKIFLDEKGVPILDDKDKQITISYASAKCNDNGTMKDGYQLALTTAQQVNINDSIRLGDDIWKYEKIKKIDFNAGNYNITNFLEKNVSGTWSRINNLTTLYSKNKHKYGAYDNLNNDLEQYKYTEITSAKIVKINSYYWAILDNKTGVQFDFKDICSNTINKTDTNSSKWNIILEPKCNYNLYSDKGLNYLEVNFFSNGTIDPEYYTGNIPTEEVHYWMNDNTATTNLIDSSTNLADGTCTVNTDTLTTTGKINGALTFSAVASCTGTETACDIANFATTATCSAQSGCTPTSAGDCSMASYPDCIGYEGCSDLGDHCEGSYYTSCDGTANACSTFGDSGTCTAQSACSWGGGASGNYCTIPNTNIPINTNPISISAWTNLVSTSAPMGVVGIADISDCGTDNAHTALFISGGNYWIAHHGGSYDWDTGQAVSTEVWHLLTYANNGTHEWAWFDGSAVADRAQTSTISASSDVRIGSWDDACGNYYFLDGAVDDVRIYNYTFNQTGVDLIWNAGAGTEDSINMSLGGGADTILPYFTTIPATTNINYSQGFGVQFVGADETALSSYAINWTTLFSINQSGWLSNISVIPVGTYNINVTINDTSNNLNSTIYQVNVFDFNKPLIQFVNPTETSGSLVNRNNIIVNVTSTDETLLSNITINLYNSTGLVNSSFSTTSPFFINFTGLSDNLYFFNATAIDSSGNENSTTTYNITLDTINPSAILNLPENGSYFNTDQNLSVNVSDFYYITTGFTGNNNYTISSLTSFKYINNSHNISIFDNNLLLMMNFDNISAIGESTTKVVDISQYSNNGTLLNGATFDNGKYGNAIKFDGVNDYINISNGFTNLIKNNNNHTVSMWVKVNSFANQPVLLDAPSLGATGYLLEFGNSNNFYWGTGNTFRTYTGLSIPAGWNYYTFVKTENTTGDFYLNGIKQNSYTGNFNTTPNLNSDLLIGAYRGVTVPLNGSVDELRFFNSSLTQEEVNELYILNLAKYSNTDWNFQAPSSITEYPCYVNGSDSEICFVPQILQLNSSGINTVKLYINNALTDTWTAVGNVVSASIGFVKNLADGIYSWFYVVTDNAGNINQTSNRTFTIDKTNPSISFVSPTNLSGVITNNNNLSISINSVETNINNITINVYNSSGFYASGNGITGSNNLNAIFYNLSDGLYLYNATSIDLAGNLNNTETRNITIDTTFPQLFLVSPIDYANLTATTRFIANASDNLGLYESTFSVSNSTTGVYARIDNYPGNLSLLLNYTTTTLPDEVYTWSYQICDFANNCNATTNWHFTIDSINPTINFTSPTLSSGSYTSNNNLTINVNSTDIHLANITINLYNQTNLLFTNVSNTSFNITYNLADGIYFYNATSIDTFGHLNNTETRNVTIDTILPSIIVSSPENITYSTSTVLINFTGSDTNINNLFYSTGGSNISYSSANLISLSNGNYLSYFYSIDLAGNINYSTVNFTVSVSGGSTSSSGGGGGNDASRSNIDAYLCNLTYNYSSPLDYTKIYGLMDIAQQNNHSFQWDKVRSYMDNWQYFCSDLINKSLDEEAVCRKAYYFIINNEGNSITDTFPTLKELEPLKVSDSLFRYYISNYKEVCYPIIELSLPKVYRNQSLVSIIPHPESCSKELGNSLFDFSMPIPKMFITSLSCEKIDKLRWIVEIDEDNFIVGIRVWAIFLILAITSLFSIIAIRKSNKKLHRKFEDFSVNLSNISV